MFTGLIEELGTVVDLIPSGTSLCLKIKAESIFRREFDEEQSSLNSAKIPQNGLKIGDSIAVNGVCLTATKVEPPYFEVTAIEETLRKTTLGSLKIGKGDLAVNLERAATVETRLGGHFVQGHVDSTMRLHALRDRKGSWEFDFEIPAAFDRYAISKGSIAIDGISLTIANVAQPSDCIIMTIAIIPHTYFHTNLQFLKAGDSVNVEFDIIAKMVERLVTPYRSQ